MGYIQDVERELRILFREAPEDANDKVVAVVSVDELITFVKQKVLESYRNGIAEGKNPRKKIKTEE